MKYRSDEYVKYMCDRPMGCVCGGDTQGVRQTCGWYTGGQL